MHGSHPGANDSLSRFGRGGESHITGHGILTPAVLIRGLQISAMIDDVHRSTEPTIEETGERPVDSGRHFQLTCLSRHHMSI